MAQNDSQDDKAGSVANPKDASSEAIAKAAANPEVAELKEQADKFKNEYLYLRAEFENYRRNVIKERADLTKYGSERLIVELLGVIDNFERALETKVSAENFLTYAKGVEMTAKELKATLGKFGVQEVASQGVPFDPNMHEALTSEPSTNVAAGNILRVLRKTYKLHDRVVRPGQVVVAREPDPAKG